MDDFIGELLEVLGNGLFTELDRIELRETIDGGAKRNALRKEFKEKDIELILSDRQVEEGEEDVDSDEESD